MDTYLGRFRNHDGRLRASDNENAEQQKCPCEPVLDIEPVLDETPAIESMSAEEHREHIESGASARKAAVDMEAFNKASAERWSTKPKVLEEDPDELTDWEKRDRAVIDRKGGTRQPSKATLDKLSPGEQFDLLSAVKRGAVVVCDKARDESTMTPIERFAAASAKRWGRKDR
jgi:hypothetical protein